MAKVEPVWKAGEGGTAIPITHDIVVIGASAGGVEALKELVRRLPADFPASIFIVVHIPPSPSSMLPDILARSGPLPAIHPEDGEKIRPGYIYVAPPDHHLTLEAGSIRVKRGPRENGYRPAIDPLFRTAARAYGRRVVGAVLTGALDCGTVGLMTVKARGGVAIVQDPKEAFCSDMPRNAIAHVQVDHILPLAEVPSLLVRLAREQIPEIEAKPMEEKSERRSEITCPECQGSMKESEMGGLLRFRCHVGHSFSMDGLAAAQTESLEAALWASVRALEESEALTRRMADRLDRRISARLKEKADAMRHHAEVIRAILLGENKVISSLQAPPRKRSKRQTV